MNRSYHRKIVLIVLVCALPLLLVAACISYPYIQYNRNLRTLDEFAKQFGFTEQNRLAEPYRWCEAGIPERCSLYVNYHTPKSREQLDQELQAISISTGFTYSGSIDGVTAAHNIDGASKGDANKYLRVNGKVLSALESAGRFPHGDAVSVIDAENSRFYIMWFPLGSSRNKYTIENHAITDNLVTIMLRE